MSESRNLAVDLDVDSAEPIVLDERTAGAKEHGVFSMEKQEETT
jgi:hypothetical protein